MLLSCFPSSLEVLHGMCPQAVVAFETLAFPDNMQRVYGNHRTTVTVSRQKQLYAVWKMWISFGMDRVGPSFNRASTITVLHQSTKHKNITLLWDSAAADRRLLLPYWLSFPRKGLKQFAASISKPKPMMSLWYHISCDRVMPVHSG